MTVKQLTLPSLAQSHRDPCDPAEAPVGFYAVTKESARLEVGGRNICEACDWRRQCNSEETDFLAYGHRCMSYAIVAFKDGKTYQREDRASVVFKKLPTVHAEAKQ